MPRAPSRAISFMYTAWYVDIQGLQVGSIHGPVIVTRIIASLLSAALHVQFVGASVSGLKLFLGPDR